MAPLDYEHDGPVGLVRMDDGKANAISEPWLAELNRLLDEAERDASCALIVHGREGFFSAGLDLKLLPALPADELRGVSRTFVRTVERLFLFPKPVIAASPGHALAAGFMLYCAADLRLALDDGRSRYGLNEVEGGVPLIGVTAAVCAEALPPAERPRVLLHGRQLTAREAHALGVVHDLVAGGEALLALARDRARALAHVMHRGAAAYRLSKLALRRPVIESAARIGDELAHQVTGNVLAGLGRQGGKDSA